MNTKRYIGQDNGATGSIGIINLDGTAEFYQTPSVKQLHYTKKVQHVSRIIGSELQKIYESVEPSIVFVERPLVNPRMWKATLSGVRAMEATIIVLEMMKIPYEVIDSKIWQREMLPRGIAGAPNLKKASKEVGSRLFPQFADLMKKQKDADGMLIAEWARRNNL